MPKAKLKRRVSELEHVVMQLALALQFTLEEIQDRAETERADFEVLEAQVQHLARQLTWPHSSMYSGC